MIGRAIVVGASSGIGAALVRRLVAEGWRVAAVARREEALAELCEPLCRDGDARARWYVHDVRDTGEARGVFDAAVKDLDGLDLLVYCAGVMPRVDLDTFDTGIDREIVEVNVIGAMSWLNLGAERFKVQGAGTLVGVGSVAGDRGRMLQPAYCASKAALHTFMESLRNRLDRHGVTVLTVKPGPVYTPLTEGLDLQMPIGADSAADGIFRAVARRARVAYVPFRWAIVMAVIRAIPSVIFRRMSI